MNRDRRAIDIRIGSLSGEAAQQTARHDDEHLAKAAREPWAQAAATDAADPAYYDRPVLKEPVWIWAVPFYFYVGGMAGAAMTLGAAAQIAGGPELRGLVRRCRWIGGIGGGVGSVLLIYDLGRPSRFLNMLRVFRPTSPMSVGAWVLAIAAPAAMGASILAEQPGLPGGLSEAGGVVSGLLGMPLAGYTAVLLGNSSVPVWQGARRSLPFLFIASAMASAASLLEQMQMGARERQLVRVFGAAGRAGELMAFRAVEREIQVERVRDALHEGGAGVLLRTAAVLTAGSLVASLLKKRFVAGVLGTLGSVALRYGVYYAGRRSARDPRASFQQQRQNMRPRIQ